MNIDYLLPVKACPNPSITISYIDNVIEESDYTIQQRASEIVDVKIQNALGDITNDEYDSEVRTISTKKYDNEFDGSWLLTGIPKPESTPMSTVKASLFTKNISINKIWTNDKMVIDEFISTLDSELEHDTQMDVSSSMDERFVRSISFNIHKYKSISRKNKIKCLLDSKYRSIFGDGHYIKLMDIVFCNGIGDKVYIYTVMENNSNGYGMFTLDNRYVISSPDKDKGVKFNII